MSELKSVIEKIEKKEKYVVITLKGDFNLECVSDFINQTKLLYTHIVIDATKLKCLTSAGIGALLLLEERNVIYFVNLDAKIQKILELPGIKRKFFYFTSHQEAEQEIHKHIS